MGERSPAAAQIHPAPNNGTMALTGVATATTGQHEVQVRSTEFDGRHRLAVDEPQRSGQRRMRST
jgi:hypothetical protein